MDSHCRFRFNAATTSVALGLAALSLSAAADQIEPGPIFGNDPAPPTGMTFPPAANAPVPAVPAISPASENPYLPGPKPATAESGFDYNECQQSYAMLEKKRSAFLAYMAAHNTPSIGARILAPVRGPLHTMRFLTTRMLSKVMYINGRISAQSDRIQAEILAKSLYGRVMNDGQGVLAAGTQDRLNLLLEYYSRYDLHMGMLDDAVAQAKLRLKQLTQFQKDIKSGAKRVTDPQGFVVVHNQTIALETINANGVSTTRPVQETKSFTNLRDLENYSRELNKFVDHVTHGKVGDSNSFLGRDVDQVRAEWSLLEFRRALINEAGKPNTPLNQPALDLIAKIETTLGMRVPKDEMVAAVRAQLTSGAPAGQLDANGEAFMKNLGAQLDARAAHPLQADKDPAVARGLVQSLMKKLDFANTPTPDKALLIEKVETALGLNDTSVRGRARAEDQDLALAINAMLHKFGDSSAATVSQRVATDFKLDPDMASIPSVDPSSATVDASGKTVHKSALSNVQDLLTLYKSYASTWDPATQQALGVSRIGALAQYIPQNKWIQWGGLASTAAVTSQATGAFTVKDGIDLAVNLVKDSDTERKQACADSPDSPSFKNCGWKYLQEKFPLIFAASDVADVNKILILDPKTDTYAMRPDVQKELDDMIARRNKYLASQSRVTAIRDRFDAQADKGVLDSDAFVQALVRVRSATEFEDQTMSYLNRLYPFDIVTTPKPDPNSISGMVRATIEAFDPKIFNSYQTQLNEILSKPEYVTIGNQLSVLLSQRFNAINNTNGFPLNTDCTYFGCGTPSGSPSGSPITGPGGNNTPPPPGTNWWNVPTGALPTEQFNTPGN